MKSSIGIMILSVMGLKVDAFTRSDWPDFGDVPPINKEWTKVALNGKTTAFNNDPDFEKCTDSQTWALTYDDGPGEFTEDRVLKPLAERNLKATFFVVGQEVAKSPDELKKIHDQGHQIGIHTWSHPELTKLSNDQIVAEIVWTARIIKNITGVTPTLFRPPCKLYLSNMKVGDIDARVRGIIKNLGLSVIMWNRDTKGIYFSKLNIDFEAASRPDLSFRNWIRGPMTGTISLQHDLFPRTSSFIKTTIDILGGSSYQAKKISECSGFEPYDDEWLENVTGDRSPPLPMSTSTKEQTTTTTPQSGTATATSGSFILNSWIFKSGVLAYFML